VELWAAFRLAVRLKAKSLGEQRPPHGLETFIAEFAAAFGFAAKL
jgi:hypothetical protein